MDKTGLMIGRFQPLHDGHDWLVKQIRDKGLRVCIGIRNTPKDKDNPYTISERINMIRERYGYTVDIIIVPDIAGVYYGRGVGYEVEELVPPEKVADISGSKIRDSVADGK
jgi:cytidyltransferase-like protein